MRHITKPYIKSEAAWIAEDLREATNTDGNTCSGFAEKGSRRCRHPIKARKSGQITSILEAVAAGDAAAKARSAILLTQAANLSVCCHHTQDADGVKRRWVQQMEAWGLWKRSTRAGTFPEKAAPAAYPGKTGIKAEQGAGDALFAIAREAAIRSFLLRVEEEAAKIAARKEEEEEEEERQLREKEKKEREETERKAREEQKKREEKLRRERERKERERRDEEERQKKEQKDREERERREREERIKERATKRAQEREMAAKKEWTDAWRRYTDCWERIKGKGAGEIDHEQVPWPVKTGKHADVTVANVRLFFLKAPQLTVPSAEANEEMFRIISQENKRWHTDKIISQFGSDIITGEYRDALDLIAKLMVELRKEAQKNRR